MVLSSFVVYAVVSTSAEVATPPQRANNSHHVALAICLCESCLCVQALQLRYWRFFSLRL